MIDVKRAVSAHLLDIVMSQQGLPRHLAAIKRYLLLGQGDFVRVLLDAAQPELDRGAKEVSQYTLQARKRGGKSVWGGKRAAEQPSGCGRLGSPCYGRCPGRLVAAQHAAPSSPHPSTSRLHFLQGHLDAALRSCAAGEDPEVLRRVDVRLPPGKVLEGDRGWDVFSLQYHVDGPLGAVLSPEAMQGGSLAGPLAQRPPGGLAS